MKNPFCFMYTCEDSIPPYNGGSSIIPPYFSYPIYTDYFCAVDGSYKCTDRYPEIFNKTEYGNYSPNTIDTEPDIFIASFLGHKVEFIYTPDESPYIKILNTKKYVVTKKVGTDGWIITSPDGTKFTFTQMDETILKHAETGPNPISRVQTRCWGLTTIEHFTGKKIEFEYTTVNEVYNLENVLNQWRGSIEMSMNQAIHIDMVRCKKIGASPIGSPTDLKTISFQSISYVKTIAFPDGKLTFSLSDRTDLNGTKKLDSIKIENLNEDVVQSYNFTYSYSQANTSFSCYSSIKTEQELSHRLILNSFSKIGTPPFIFEYNQSSLPKKNSFARDYWGYFNGHNNQRLYPNLYRFNHDSGITPGPPGIGSDNHSAHPEFIKAGILKKIIYPTGGSTAFNYELNSFATPNTLDQIPDYSGNLGVVSYGDGLRIKTINKFDDELTKVLTTEYSYFGGISLDYKRLFDTEQFNQATVINTPDCLEYGIYSFNSLLTSTSTFTNTPLVGITGVGYSKVVTEVTSDDFDNGIVEYYFFNTPNRVSSFGTSLPSIPNMLNGVTEKIIKYDAIMNKITKESMHHSLDYSDFFSGARHSFDGYQIQSFIALDYCDYCIEEQFLLGMYPIFSAETLLDSTDIVYYFGNDSINITTSYVYDSRNQLISNATTDSKGKEQKEQFTYPYDVYQLITSNRINKPIEIEKYVDDVLIIGETETYNYFGGHYFSSGFYKWNSSEIFDVVKYDNYDQNGNIIQYHLYDDQSNTGNNLNVTILWGYNYTLPVAKIENASYSEVMSALESALNISGYDELQSKNSDELNQIFDALRTQMSNVNVWNYSYKPLINLSSETDPNGFTTYYEYDALNRLETINDHNGKVIKHFDYHYKDE